MTKPTHSHRLRSALRVAVLPFLSLALVSCASDMEPELRDERERRRREGRG